MPPAGGRSRGPGAFPLLPHTTVRSLIRSAARSAVCLAPTAASFVAGAAVDAATSAPEAPVFDGFAPAARHHAVAADSATVFAADAAAVSAATTSSACQQHVKSPLAAAPPSPPSPLREEDFAAEVRRINSENPYNYRAILGMSPGGFEPMIASGLGVCPCVDGVW